MRGRIIADISAEQSVRWVCIVGPDGLPIEAEPADIETTEIGAALTATLLTAGSVELGDRAERVTLIGSDGILIVIRIDDAHDLAVAMERTPRHGAVRSTAIHAARRLATLMPR